MSTPAPKQMTCMEVWGGNQAMKGGVVMPYLNHLWGQKKGTLRRIDTNNF